MGQTAEWREAVLAVFLTSGKATNKSWQPYIAAARQLTGGGQTVEAEIDYSKLLPSAVAGYRYDGSLTTPPCTQGVSWNVAAHPVRISKAQMTTLQAVPFTQAPEGPNNRPVQALNGRSIISNIRVTNGSD